MLMDKDALMENVMAGKKYIKIKDKKHVHAKDHIVAQVVSYEQRFRDSWGPMGPQEHAAKVLVAKYHAQVANFWDAIASGSVKSAIKHGDGMIRGLLVLEQNALDRGHVPAEAQEMVNIAIGTFPGAEVTGGRRKRDIDDFDDEIPF